METFNIQISMSTAGDCDLSWAGDGVLRVNSHTKSNWGQESE